MATNIEIPEGYVEDAKGRLVPREMVKEIDIIRDEMIMNLVPQAIELSEALRKFKIAAFGDILDFSDLSESLYHKKVGGNKGNANLFTYNGKFKIERSVNDLLEFDERLQTAKNLIDECINDWSSDAKDELKILVEGVFEVDKKGNVNTKRILELRKYNIEDERWKTAMTAIADSLKIIGSKSYVRIYERTDDGKWQNIPLSLSAV